MKIKVGSWLLLIVGGFVLWFLLRQDRQAGAPRAEAARALQLIAVAETAREDACPHGCSYRKPGCDIKGNVAFETGERIYHVPGQTYYEEADIRPERGERWFCTEDEAVENGWRRARL